MSRKSRKKLARRAPIFAALGDPTRLALLARLSRGQPRSISQLTSESQLTSDSTITRQAVTKHLRVLEAVGIVRCSRSGRESLFHFDPQPLADMQKYLDRLASRWDDALARLQSFAER